jgi:hypothetical protein
MSLERIEEINNLLNQGESKDQSQKGEALHLLENAFSMYEELRRVNGKSYCSNKCPDIPRRMNMLVDKLMEYDS